MFVRRMFLGHDWHDLFQPITVSVISALNIPVALSTYSFKSHRFWIR